MCASFSKSIWQQTISFTCKNSVIHSVYEINAKNNLQLKSFVSILRAFFSKTSRDIKILYRNIFVVHLMRNNFFIYRSTFGHIVWEINARNQPGCIYQLLSLFFLETTSRYRNFVHKLFVANLIAYKFSHL